MATSPKQSFAARLLALPPEEALKALGTGTPDEHRSLEFADRNVTAHLFAGALNAAVREEALIEAQMAPQREAERAARRAAHQ